MYLGIVIQNLAKVARFDKLLSTQFANHGSFVMFLMNFFGDIGWANQQTLSFQLCTRKEKVFAHVYVYVYIY